ncbi:hypothetical protein BGZ60DRAFT_175728 [Tricladium varicosporioides]|nr:hypothetical protein BGZ60DRAFT_175728 [Hymenoscyphus varicosporioides]
MLPRRAREGCYCVRISLESWVDQIGFQSTKEHDYPGISCPCGLKDACYSCGMEVKNIFIELAFTYSCGSHAVGRGCRDFHVSKLPSRLDRCLVVELWARQQDGGYLGHVMQWIDSAGFRVLEAVGKVVQN